MAYKDICGVADWSFGIGAVLKQGWKIYSSLG
jgi:hypothetical protein